jgi:hypothetical protein
VDGPHKVTPFVTGNGSVFVINFVPQVKGIYELKITLRKTTIYVAKCKIIAGMTCRRICFVFVFDSFTFRYLFIIFACFHLPFLSDQETSIKSYFESDKKRFAVGSHSVKLVAVDSGGAKQIVGGDTYGFVFLLLFLLLFLFLFLF